MTKFYVPSKGPADWQRLLGDPVKHWRTGYSAKTLAHCWESADGFPPEIAHLLRSLGGEPELLVAIPEHKVPLPGSSVGGSQNDLFVLVRVGANTVAITIEGKVEEAFDQPLSKWLTGASEGKKKRLAYICELLDLKQPLPGEIKYQLLHRTASALIEAQRFKTDLAAMIVHSFSSQNSWFNDFEFFVALFDKTVHLNELIPIRTERARSLYVGWACGDRKFLAA